MKFVKSQGDVAMSDFIMEIAHYRVREYPL